MSRMKSTVVYIRLVFLHQQFLFDFDRVRSFLFPAENENFCRNWDTLKEFRLMKVALSPTKK